MKALHVVNTAFGFNYYIDYKNQPVYFRPGDPDVDIEWKGDQRKSEKRFADQTAGESAAAAYEENVKRRFDEKRRVEDWRKLFHSKSELENAPKFSFAIDGFLQEGGITMIGGKSGDGKTLIAMEMAKCLLEGSPLFGHFPVLKPAKRIIYLIPESGLSAFAMRLDLFGLKQFADTKFFSRTLDSKEPNAPIMDPAILKACEGADVFLDTAVRFMLGDENAAADSKRFADNLFALLRAGARTVTGLHHAPKAFERAQYMTLENILRGSGDIGAMLAACWGVAQVERKTTGVYVENVKARDFEPCDSFLIAGRPSINETGHFLMTAKPGMAGSYSQQKARGVQAGRPAMTSERDAAWQLLGEGKSVQEIAAALSVTERSVRRWGITDKTKRIMSVEMDSPRT